jgi:hypothetical protein
MGLKLVAGALAGLLAALPGASPARAATLEGVTLPDSTKVDGQSLVLNGIGLRTLTIFNVEIYVAGLYLAQPSHDTAAIEASKTSKVLVLHYLHSGSKAEVEKEYRAGEENNCGHGECPAQDGTDFEKLIALAPAVAPGDTTTYIIKATGFDVLANDKPLASFPNPDLGMRILDGFIGAHPPSQSLKNALLGIK